MGAGGEGNSGRADGQQWSVVVVVVTRSDQPKPPAIAIVRQNGLSSASCRASVAVTPMSRQIWWIQVVGGRPLARLHSCEGRSPSLALVQIRRNQMRWSDAVVSVHISALVCRRAGRISRHSAQTLTDSDTELCWQWCVSALSYSCWSALHSKTSRPMFIVHVLPVLP